MHTAVHIMITSNTTTRCWLRDYVLSSLVIDKFFQEIPWDICECYHEIVQNKDSSYKYKK